MGNGKAQNMEDKGALVKREKMWSPHFVINLATT